MKVGDLVVTKTHRHVGCIIDIKWRRLQALEPLNAGICAKVLIFEMGEKWIKIDQLQLFDKDIKE